ncbi:MAG TPA: trypsin-like peptidase domain-containing protein [Trinickia sp.]|uniref:trypsin-like peptidase domain-containing protein n=1 Tax=Trinickia sp. TaxID=2571163 RepID=UPI002B798EB6|nr:trypsin-like peptidase domain-containing protein [Trinickia sp.]HTI17155.1 trypsin-like peptidase domain-containing protein [Trinickia sp.]
MAAPFPPPPPPTSASGPVDFPSIVERYGAAVVNISAASSSEPENATPLDAIDTEDPLAAFFKRGAPAQDGPTNPPRVVWGSGSGFIISPDGLVLTTAHIVNRAEEVTVRLSDRREFKAKVLATDPQTNVAVLQIEGGTKLPFVKLGDSSHVRVGEQLLSIGAPDGPANTVTAGLVSAQPRVLADGTAFSYFQTDIAVHPDNSGGPLFNRAGEVIGIDVQVYAETERFRVLTFAIPINTAIAFSRTQASNKSARGSFGIEVQDIDPGLAAAFGLARPSGALVTAVAPAVSSRSTANGLKAGDVITVVSGRIIERASDFIDYVGNLQPGAKATLRVIRNKRPMAMVLTVGGSDEAQAARPKASSGVVDRIGLSVRPLTESERRANGLSSGLLVDGAAGLAASAGIQAGDAVLSVNGTPIASRDDLNALLERSGKEIALLIQRDNTRSFVSLELK